MLDLNLAFPSPATTSARNDHLVAGGGELPQGITAVGGDDHGSRRHRNAKVRAVTAGAVLALSMPAPLGPENAF